MKQHATKKRLSVLCMVLALCMTFQSVTLAADISADTSSSVTSSAAAEEADADETVGAEDAEETEDDEELQEAEEPGEPESDAPTEETDTSAPAEEETPTDSAEDTEEADSEDEADEAVTAQATTYNGWVYNPTNDAEPYWTFYYKKSSTATTAVQAKDVVLFLPEDCTKNSTTFSAGCYYFDAEGRLVADGETASVGTIVVLKVTSGTYVRNTSATDSGKVAQVVTTQTAGEDGTAAVSSTMSYYTGAYTTDGTTLYYSNGVLYTGFFFTSAGYLYYVTDGVAESFTGKYEASNQDTYGSTTYTGDDLWYYKGEKFTGYVRRTSSDTVWVVTDGVGGTKLTGQMSTSTAYVRMDTGAKSTGDGLWYYNGSKYTGYLRRTSSDTVWVVSSGKGGTKLTGQMSTSTAYVRVDTGTKSKGDGLWYYKGEKYTGYLRRSSSDVYWVVTNGKGGTKLTGIMSTSKYYLRSDTGSRSKGNGKCYSNGVLYTGGYNGYYYKKGVKVTGLSGWKTFDSSGNTSSKASDNTYYFSGGKYLTGWNNVKRNGTTYRYYFNSDGTLCKNLYKVSSAWKQKDTKLVISRSTHTATLYAKYNGSYTIPTKSFVVSTSIKSSNFKVGTYKLTSRKSWFTISTTRWWYKWATYISGSGSWCHSEQYYTKGNSKSLRVSSYNDLGTNQSKQCIRMQVVNAKLIYDMKGYGSIKTVVLNKSSNAGPFGKMTITNNVDKNGKLSGTKSYDPTDPLYT